MGNIVCSVGLDMSFVITLVIYPKRDFEKQKDHSNVIV
jgi:hypothetical protein